MLEVAIFILLASGLWFLRQNWQQQANLPLLQNPDASQSPILAYGGLYRLAMPQEQTTFRAFQDLRLVDNGLVLSDNQTGESLFFSFAQVQWVTAIHPAENALLELSIHLELAQQWRILSLKLPEVEMRLLAKVLQQTVTASRLDLNRGTGNAIGPVKAHITEDSLQGDSSIGAEVQLYLLPHLLLVLQGDMVKAKLDISSIRRVLAVERFSNTLDSLLPKRNPEGILRLYSLHETAAFALNQFREMAEEISFLARCPIEFISQEDKSSKF